MKKELKVFAPLYLGCECITPDGIMILNGINTVDIKHSVWFYCRWNDKKNCYLPKQNGDILMKQSLVGKSYKYSEIKLILRPLSTMTEEEQEKYDENDNFQNKFCSDEQALRIECEAEKTKFLLSKHFDLFGLIEAGLAVNAAELKSVSSR